MKIIAQNEEETQNAAAELAQTLKNGDVILLHGTLGMGKTVFARALIRKLTNRPDLDVPSPTFTLVQTYEADDSTIYHYDLYRIEDPEEILQLGWEDSLTDGITLVEWPERLGPYKPAQTLDITLSSAQNTQNTREILIERNE